MQGKGKVTDCHPRPSPPIPAYYRLFLPIIAYPLQKNKNMAVHKKYNRNAKTNALGRGLDALISTESVSTQGSSTINEVALDQIEANPNQPRREFAPEALNAIEIALAYEHLLEKSGMTQERVAERVGKSRAAIANYLRLLKLPAQVQMGLQKKEIDMGHARALLSLDSPSLQLKLYREILKNGYSVRKVEELCQQLNSGEDIQSAKKKIAARTRLPEEFNLLKQRLSAFFDTKVQMSCNTRGKGKISIPFDSEEELLHIMEVMDKMK